MSVIVSSLLHGFFLSLAMIMAIGAQNAFILRQGIKGQHVLVACFICALCDASLIIFGSLGLGSFIAAHKIIQLIMCIFGSAFLAIYAYNSLRQALATISTEEMVSTENNLIELKKIILMSVAFSILNPHAWLDTVVVIGSVSSQYNESVELLAFTFGACLVSFMWFFLLGFLAKKFRKFLLLVKVQKGINFFIAFLMASISLSLARFGLELL